MSALAVAVEQTPWQEAAPEDVVAAVVARDDQLLSDHSTRYERFRRAYQLIGEDPDARDGQSERAAVLAMVPSENVIAQAVEARASELTQGGRRVAITATSADYEQRLQAETTEWYADAAYFRHRLALLHYQAAKDAIVAGIGGGVIADVGGRPVPERVHPCDMRFDDVSTVESPEFGVSRRVSLRKLQQDYPEHAEHLERAERVRHSSRDEVEVLEYWYDGGGDDSDDPQGRHVAVVRGMPMPLFDDEWHGPPPRWYCRAECGTLTLVGPSLVLRAEGLQMEHDRLSRFIRDSGYKRVPRTLFDVSKIDAHHIDNEAGGAIPVKGSPEGTILDTAPVAVHPEAYERLRELRTAIFRAIGANEMFSSGELPAGIRSGSGRAIKHYRENRSRRHRPSELELDYMAVRLVEELLRAEARLAEEGRKVEIMTSGFTRQVAFSELLWDPDSIQLQAAPASDLPLEVAVRVEMLAELVSDGILPIEQFYASAAVVDWRDAERVATSDTRLCELYVSRILREKKAFQPPKYVPYERWLQMSVRRLCLAELDGAGDDRLVHLRAWVDELAARVSDASQPPPDAGAMMMGGPLLPDPAGAPPMDPAGMPPMPEMGVPPVGAN